MQVNTFSGRNQDRLLRALQTLLTSGDARRSAQLRVPPIPPEFSVMLSGFSESQPCVAC